MCRYIWLLRFLSSFCTWNPFSWLLDNNITYGLIDRPANIISYRVLSLQLKTKIPWVLIIYTSYFKYINCSTSLAHYLSLTMICLTVLTLHRAITSLPGSIITYQSKSISGREINIWYWCNLIMKWMSLFLHYIIHSLDIHHFTPTCLYQMSSLSISMNLRG